MPATMTESLQISPLVAEEVRAWLGRRRITQTALARALGLSQPAVSNRLKGTTPFDVNELATTAQLLDIPLERLLGPLMKMTPEELRIASEVRLPHLDSNQKPAG